MVETESNKAVQTPRYDVCDGKPGLLTIFDALISPAPTKVSPVCQVMRIPPDPASGMQYAGPGKFQDVPPPPRHLFQEVEILSPSALWSLISPIG